MEVIKRHKGLAIVGSLALILLIILFIIFGRMIFLSEKDAYGNRLNGIVQIDQKETDKMVEEIKKNTEVKDIKVRTQGKIINMTITYNDDVSKDTAKKIAEKTFSYYSEEVIKCYDFGYLLIQDKEVKEDEEDTSFKIAGTKQASREKISWTKN